MRLPREARGFELSTDERAPQLWRRFPGAKQYMQSPPRRRPAARCARLAAARSALGRGMLQALALLGEIKPRAVVCFGGYPTVPPVLARRLRAACRRSCTSRMPSSAAPIYSSASRVDAIANGFPDIAGLSARGCARKARLTGNPVRPAVIEAAALPFPDFADNKLRLLVTGGSQGARIMSDVVPAAIGLLPEAARQDLVVVQQARGEDLAARAQSAYAAASTSMPMSSPSLPICRPRIAGGPSGHRPRRRLDRVGTWRHRPPAILVPLPHALDQRPGRQRRRISPRPALATSCARPAFHAAMAGGNALRAGAGRSEGLDAARALRPRARAFPTPPNGSPNSRSTSPPRQFWPILEISQ